MTIYRIYNRDLFCNLHNHTTQSNIKGLNSNKGRIASRKNKKKTFLDNEINKYHFWFDAIRFVLNGLKITQDGQSGES